MHKIHLLGSSTLTGKSFCIENKSKYKILCYSRKNKKDIYLDINNIKSYSNIDFKSFDNSFLVSFAPIWETVKFFELISRIQNNEIRKLKGIILCSSSSVVTKRFAINSKDKDLYKSLLKSENKIINLSNELNIPCLIIRPTIIYGKQDNLNDSNLFIIKKFLNKIPFIILPRNVGKRQPIHAAQLAKVVLKFIDKLLIKKDNIFFKDNTIEIGGDEILSYKDMLERLQDEKNIFPFFNSKILSVPNFIFYIFTIPFLIISPKLFETIFRISSDFAGFTKCSNLTNEIPRNFPYRKY
tara:strand:- start:2826 stop:3716 length:891 start_codon:yes stop_codon:yes gene_type:complete